MNTETQALIIDGAIGEGGGQILRTSIALSIMTGKPIQIYNIRANRPKPGLQRQHLTAIQAAAHYCGGKLSGAHLSSTMISFTPGQARNSQMGFTTEGAGSVTLVFQTLFPVFLWANEPFTLHLEGGTHNPFAPPVDFIEQTFLRSLKSLNWDIQSQLIRPGFYPSGGGMWAISGAPGPGVSPFKLLEKGKSYTSTATVWVSRLPDIVAQRQVQNLQAAFPECKIHVNQGDISPGAGNSIHMHIIDELGHIETFSAFGKRGIVAEQLCQEIIDQATAYIQSGRPVGQHLADQLLLPLWATQGGEYCVESISEHTRTNIEIIKLFTQNESVEVNDHHIKVHPGK